MYDSNVVAGFIVTYVFVAAILKNFLLTLAATRRFYEVSTYSGSLATRMQHYLSNIWVLF